ncbi:MAG: hypothetical protein HQL66_06945 [Magnetococcales bacterium]|nr:hypothetical protein [Magnetococcales bacterium]
MPDLRIILAVGLLITTTPLPPLDAAESWKDPTAPPDPTLHTKKKSDSDGESVFTISMLLVGSARHLAIVNGTLVRAGDRVAGALVTSITARGVRLTHKGRKIHLPAPIQVSDPKKFAGLRDEP